MSLTSGIDQQIGQHERSTVRVTTLARPELRIEIEMVPHAPP